MSEQTAIEDLSARIVAGDTRSLARAATLIEARTSAGRELSKTLFARTGRARILGITGLPGAGKSTLVDRLIRLLRAQGKTVGILAVDPSSPFSRGAILGDRIRMQDHHADPGVFVRSMAARGKLGGVAQSTLDLALLLDAAGRDFVLIETVGVGQGEIEIARLADLTLLVLVPGMGDDVQAIKAGTMEIADVFVINKSDLPGAGRLEQEIRAMQSLGADHEGQEAARVLQVSAATGQGIDELLTLVEQLFEKRQHRNVQTRTWSLRLAGLLEDRLSALIPHGAVEEHALRVAEKMEDPYTAVEAILGKILKGDRT